MTVLSDDTLRVLHAYLGAIGTTVSAAYKVALTEQVQKLIEEGHDPAELTRRVQVFARSSRPASSFGAWVRREPRAWWTD